MLESVTECYRVLQSITENSRVLQNIKEYYRVFLAHLLGPISGLVSIKNMKFWSIGLFCREVTQFLAYLFYRPKYYGGVPKLTNIRDDPSLRNDM